MFKQALCVWLVCVFTSLSGAASRVRPAADTNDPDIGWIKKVANWQLGQNNWNQGNNWEHGTLFTGMMATYEATKDDTYLDATRAWAEKYHWHLASDNTRHADHYCCAQAYLELYFLDQADPNRIAHVKENCDRIVNNPYHFQCDSHSSSVWSWCDALYMQPAVLARLSRALNEPAYIDVMNMMWNETQNCLYDPQESLFYRDISYFDDRVDGKKVFWARGNGWVFGGLVRVLQYLPLDDPFRSDYITTFQAMAARLAEIQRPDGYWHANLLDPQQYDMPETSGTGFFCYGIAWGINHGLLDPNVYTPVAEAAWTALKNAVQENGLLGWVQAPGAGPNSSSATSTQVYGVGAYLLAGSEMRKLHLSQDPGLLDSFETYVSTSQDSPALTASWQDGAAHGSSATIELGNYGDRFMILHYDNTTGGQFAQVDHMFAEPQDWLADHDAALSLLVQGRPDNNDLPVTVVLQDAAGHVAMVTCPDANLVTSHSWRQWATSLTSFATVDLSKVTRLSLRVGPGIGRGTVRVDTVRLIPPDYESTDARDLDHNGRIDFKDFADFAQKWGQQVAQILEPMASDDNQLTAYWDLDETSGALAYDSSGHGNYGVAVNTDWLPTAGHTGGAVQFNGADQPGTRIEFPTSAFHLDAGTVSLWVYLDAQQTTPDTRYLFGHTTLPAYADRIQLYMDHGDTQLDLGLGDNHALVQDVTTLETERWTHIALTWDGHAYQVFVDGLLKASGIYSGLTQLQSKADLGNNGSQTGTSNPNQGLNGRLDEVRCYGQVLGDAEILYLAQAPAQVQIDHPDPADFVLDGRINALDLKAWTQAWLLASVWP